MSMNLRLDAYRDVFVVKTGKPDRQYVEWRHIAQTPTTVTREVMAEQTTRGFAAACTMYCR
ncbi:MAG: hypothetical protein WC505_07680 [Patescibacteria group bacterium]